MKNLLRKHALTLSMLIGAVVAIAIAGFSSFAAECEQIPEGVLRLHILAESNSKEDQDFKLKLRDFILENFTKELNECGSADAAIEKSRILLPEIERLSQEFTDKNRPYREGQNNQIKAEVTEMYFTTRRYENVTMPAGNYTALRITIGAGQGENWWCVMFPLLCLPACTERPVTVDAVSIPGTIKDSPKIKFAMFEMMSKWFKK